MGRECGGVCRGRYEVREEDLTLPPPHRQSDPPLSPPFFTSFPSVAADLQWMGAREAARWVLAKLSAAEAMWRMMAGGAARPDFALTMNGPADEDFFMSDSSQE
jgi:hypothetical protein